MPAKQKASKVTKKAKVKPAPTLWEARVPKRAVKKQQVKKQLDPPHDGVKLDDKLVTLLKPAIVETWQAVAADVEASCRVNRTKLTNLAAVEVSIDFIEMYGGKTGKQAQTVFRTALLHHPYDKLVRWLAKQIQLA